MNTTDPISTAITEMVARAIDSALQSAQPRWVCGWKSIANHLGISLRTAIEWGDKGIITIHRKGKIILADLNELDKCIKSL